MGRRHRTVCEGVFTDRGGGKTYYLCQRALALAELSDVHCILFFDPTGSVQDFFRPGQAEFYWSWRSFLDRIDTTRRLPRIAVLELGTDPESYLFALQWAISYGDVAVVIDEVHLFAPANTGPFCPELFQISTMGRHLLNSEGRMCQVDLLVASQRPTGVHTSIRDNLSTVVVGRMRGDAALRWLRAEHGSEVAERAKTLGQYELIVVHPEGSRLPARKKLTL